MPMIPIEDPDDPRIAAYRDVREGDLAGREGLFIAEGEVVVRILCSPRSRFRPESLLMSQARAIAASGWLADLAPACPVFVAPGSVMDRIVGFPIHRGLLAAGRRPPADAPPVELPPSWEPAIVVGLVGLANHDNVGAIFRNAAAFGASAIVADAACCDPLYRKAIRVSAGTVLTMPYGHGGDVSAMVSRLIESGFDLLALSPAGRERLDRVVWPARSALLVGTEGSGLPAGLLARLKTVRIDMQDGVDSLNVAAATAIALHAARLGAPVRSSGSPVSAWSPQAD